MGEGGFGRGENLREVIGEDDSKEVEENGESGVKEIKGDTGKERKK